MISKVQDNERWGYVNDPSLKHWHAYVVLTVGERWVATDGTKGWKINAVKLLYDDDGTFGVKVPLHGRPRNGDFKKLQARLHQGLLDAANRDNR